VNVYIFAEEVEIVVVIVMAENRSKKELDPYPGLFRGQEVAVDPGVTRNHDLNPDHVLL